jgi:hypothetical protein
MAADFSEKVKYLAEQMTASGELFASLADDAVGDFGSGPEVEPVLHAIEDVKKSFTRMVAGLDQLAEAYADLQHRAAN